MKILVASMYKNLIKLEVDAVHINTEETVNITKILRKLRHKVVIGSAEDTEIAVAYDKLDINSFDKVLIMNSIINCPEGIEN